MALDDYIIPLEKLILAPENWPGGLTGPIQVAVNIKYPPTNAETFKEDFMETFATEINKLEKMNHYLQGWPWQDFIELYFVRGLNDYFNDRLIYYVNIRFPAWDPEMNYEKTAREILEKGTGQNATR